MRPLGLLTVALALVALATLGACNPAKVSGAYVYSGTTEVAMLQLVEGADGSLSGSLQTATANASNRVNVESVALSGTIDGNTLTLSTPTFLGMSTTFSGVRSGNDIALTFTTSGNVNTITFQRSSPDEFTRLTEQLRQGAFLRATERERQQAEARARAADEQMRQGIPRLSAEFEQTAANDVTMTTRVDAAVARFEALTQQARDAARARSREGDGVRRSQLSVYISQVSIETNGLNIEVESAQRQFEDHRASLRQQLERANAWCARTRDAVCGRLSTASARYATESAALIAAFGRASAAHQRAEQEQDQLASLE